MQEIVNNFCIHAKIDKFIHFKLHVKEGKKQKPVEIWIYIILNIMQLTYLCKVLSMWFACLLVLMLSQIAMLSLLPYFE